MASDPVLLRLPFSHYCRKVEWGLSYAGIPYEALDVTLPEMVRLRRVNLRQGTVPMIRLPAGAHPLLLDDSHDILLWADRHRTGDRPSLYPSGAESWESWAAQDVGPLVRRTAYRILHDRPGLARRFETPFWYGLPVARRMYLAVLKHEKARRFEQTDAGQLAAAVKRVHDQLEASRTPWLLGPSPSAAEAGVAALLEPLVVLGAAAGLRDLPGGDTVAAWVKRARPPSTLTRRRRMRRKDWQDWEALASQVHAPKT